MTHKQCIVNECDRPYRCKGYCSKHDQEFRKYGAIDNRKAIIEGNIARIPLGRGAKQGYAVVDKEDAWVDQSRWSNHRGYAITGAKGVLLHRLLMRPTATMVVDHINLDTLDNRRSNLRVCTRTENSRNSPKHRNNTTGFKGVVRWNGRYVAKLGYLGKKLHLGYFDNPEDAAIAYDTKALELHGKFAKLNFQRR